MLLKENYSIQKKNVKYARIQIHPSAGVSITVPLFYTASDIEELLRKKSKWIEKHLSNFAKNHQAMPIDSSKLLLMGEEYEIIHQEKKSLGFFVEVDKINKIIFCNRNLHEEEVKLNFYKFFAKKEIPERVKKIAAIHGFKYNKIFIRSQKTKWGTCTSTKNLGFNYKLVKTPPAVLDYVIIHVLVHTWIMNHQQEFWLEVAKICPQYKDSVRWLKQYGYKL